MKALEAAIQHRRCKAVQQPINRIVYLALTCQCRSSAEAADICHLAGEARAVTWPVPSNLHTFPGHQGFIGGRDGNRESAEMIDSTVLTGGSRHIGSSLGSAGYFGNSVSEGLQLIICFPQCFVQHCLKGCGSFWAHKDAG